MDLFPEILATGGFANPQHTPDHYKQVPHRIHAAAGLFGFFSIAWRKRRPIDFKL
jgi:hypothetical protein